MAANLKGRAIAVGFGKRIANQIWSPLPSLQPSAFRSVAHYSSSYDKNVEDHVRPAVVPDYVIESESDKYWGPHPTTGVFGPSDPNTAPGGGRLTANSNGSSSSVLDQTAWFRPLEDVEKPIPESAN